MIERMRVLPFALLLTTLPLQVHACACCADPGHRVTYTDDVDDWHQRQMAEIVFAPRAYLYSDACGDDCILGVADPKRDYDVSVERIGDTWHIRLGHDGSVEGQLQLKLPETYQHFATDLSPTSNSTMRATYGEYRHVVRLEGEGSFLTSEPVDADLIFAGQSPSRCDALALSTHWFIDVRTETVRWRLYGDLIPATP